METGLGALRVAIDFADRETQLRRVDRIVRRGVKKKAYRRRR